MTLRFFFLISALTSIAGLWPVAAQERPNVVLVITDDQGYGDISAHGNPVLKTPALDELHGESIRLTDYHVSPTCSPSRGALMSGHFTNRAGPWHTIMGRSLLFRGEATLGEVFANSGYRTGMFGKWHLGDNYPYRPEDRGFHEVVRHGGGGVGQTPDYWNNAYFDDTYFHNGKPKKFEGYCTDVYFDSAKRFIEDSVAREEPFFAYISTNAPHSPFHVADRYWKPYMEEGLSEREAIFFGMVANIDDNVGAIREWLAARDLQENTLFIFTTDNGTANGEKVWNAGMRGKKGSEYDGGHRVPFFLHWPKAGLRNGRDIAQLSAHVDVLPTLIDLCGLQAPVDYFFDGRSLAPLIFQLPTAWPDRFLVTDSQRVQDPIKWRKSSVMTQRWRLINGKELYDMANDPGQEKDIASERPEVVRNLRGNYENWWRSLEPSFSKFAELVLGNPAENPAVLTSHDWLSGNRGVAWNQSSVRGGKIGSGYPGKWAVEVETAGTYQFSLRRWPLESNAGLDDALPPGEPVPGLTAFRETPGKALKFKGAFLKVGDQSEEKPVSSGQEGVDFSMELPPGKTYIEAYFTTAEGEKMGVYYILVEKV